MRTTWPTELGLVILLGDISHAMAETARELIHAHEMIGTYSVTSETKWQGCLVTLKDSYLSFVPRTVELGSRLENLFRIRFTSRNP